MADLVTITTDAGTRVRVARDQAQRMLDTLNDVEMRYPLNPNPQETAGFNYRNIAGTNKLSEHAHGRAVDVNASQNARGSTGDIRRYFTPAELSDAATQHGMTWGGSWKSPDDMHFEVARGAGAAPLGSPSHRLPASAGLNEPTEAGLQPLSLLPAYRAQSPFTPTSETPRAAPTAVPPPAVAMAPPPPAKETPPPFAAAQPKKAADSGLDQFHDAATQQAQRVAQEWAARKMTPLSFGGLS